MTSIFFRTSGAGRSAALCSALLVAACGSDAMPSSGSDAGTDAAAESEASVDAVPAGGYSLSGFEGGTDFYLTLPPSFSPFLPLSGEEVTRETPGFHDSNSDEYFSYEFLWWLDGMPDFSTEALRDDLQNYFIGLCPSSNAAVTLDSADTDAGIVAPLVARRTGTLDAGTCFGAAVPRASLEVSTYDCPDHDGVIVIVSPQAPTSRVGSELRAVRDSFACR